MGQAFRSGRRPAPTTTPFITDKEFASKNPVGKGDKNANLTALEKFFGWTVQVVPQSVPAPTDWMAPHDLLSYDINHSDGFWVIDANQTVRFASGDLPAFTGTLSKVLSTFMGYKSNIYNSPVYKGAGHLQKRSRQSNGSPMRNYERATTARYQVTRHRLLTVSTELNATDARCSS